MGRPVHPGWVCVLAYGPPVHTKSHALMHVEVCPAGTVKNPTWRRSAGLLASMMCTAPYGNVAPEVADVVNPRGSRLRNTRLRTESTSMSSFSHRYMGRTPMSAGAAGSEM